MSKYSFEIRVIPIWHILILAVLSFYVIIAVYGFSKNVEGWIFLLAFAGPLFFGCLLSMAFGKIKIDAKGIKFRMYRISFNEIDKIRLKWNGRLMTYGKKLDLGFILLNPKKFVEAISIFKPEALADYIYRQEDRN